MSSMPAPSLRREVVAQVLGRQVVEVGARGDERAARLRHLLAVDGQEAVHEHARRRAEAGAVQHRGPEQRVEVDDVLADEVVQLGVAVRAPVAVEIAARCGGRYCSEARRCSRSARRTRRRSTCRARRESRSRSRARRARCPSRCRPGVEPFVELGAHRLLQPPGAGPFAQHRLEVAELEEQVLGFALHRRACRSRPRPGPSGRPACRWRRRLRSCRRTGRACRTSGRCRARSDRAGTSAPARRRPARSSRARDVAAGRRAAVDLVRELAVLVASAWCGSCRTRCRTSPKSRRCSAPIALDQLLGRDAFLPRLEHDRRAVRVARRRRTGSRGRAAAGSAPRCRSGRTRRCARGAAAPLA